MDPTTVRLRRAICRLLLLCRTSGFSSWLLTFGTDALVTGLDIIIICAVPDQLPLVEESRSRYVRAACAFRADGPHRAAVARRMLRNCLSPRIQT